MTSLIHGLDQILALKDLGPVNYFIGIQVSSILGGGPHCSERKYIIDLLSCKNAVHKLH